MDQHSPAIDQATLARFSPRDFSESHKADAELYSDRREFFIEQFNHLLSKHFILEIRKLATLVGGYAGRQIYPVITRVCAEIGIRPSRYRHALLSPS